MFAGIALAMNARISLRNASCSGVNERSMSLPPGRNRSVSGGLGFGEHLHELMNRPRLFRAQRSELNADRTVTNPADGRGQIDREAVRWQRRSHAHRSAVRELGASADQHAAAAQVAGHELELAPCVNDD